MAFHHLAGTTTQGAADPVVDWFATFEAWISLVVGWTIVAGAGTTALTLMSTGEGAAYTKLYVRIWRDGITNHVRGEVWDDAAGTHKTTAGGYLDFPCRRIFWMTADLDCIILIVPDGDRDRILYLGIIEPVANNPVDETYHMIATDDILFISNILRNSAGLWNQALNNFPGALSGQCQYDGMFTPGALYGGSGNTMAGQLKYLSSQIPVNTHPSPTDELTSVITGATSKWKVFCDGTWKFAMMIEGGQPGAITDGAHFAHQTGPVASTNAFITAILPPFMVGIGWQDLGDVGVDNFCRLFYSQGESGTEHIYVLVSYNAAAGGNFYLYVQDDALGTHRIANVYSPAAPAAFPATYFMSADRNCLVFTYDNYFGAEPPSWVGRTAPLNPNLPDATYSMGASSRYYTRYGALRGHDGTWTPTTYFITPNARFANSNANAYDANTYIVAPHTLSTRLPGGGNINDPIGNLPYYFYTNGGGVAYPDTITVGVETYQVFSSIAGTWAMRTA